MSERDAFDRILASMHDATLDETRWPATSALIDEVCGLTGNGLMVGEGPKDDVRARFVGLYFRGQRREDLEREYLTTYHAIDERVPRFRQLPARRLVHITDLYTAEELQDLTDLQRDPAPGRHAGRPERPAPRAGPLPHRLGPARSRRRGGLGGVADHDDPAAAAPCPAVRPRPAGRWLAPTPWARRSPTCSRPPGWASSSWTGAGGSWRRTTGALDLLRTGDGLCDQNGVLGAGVPADDAVLQGLLTRALPPVGGQGAGGSMTVRRAADPLPLVVHLLPIGRPEPAVCTWPGSALVLVVDPARRPRLDPALVAAGLGLTPMESRVAVLLTEGKSLREVAMATGRKDTTIRWHLRQIFAKCGIARQAELVRLVLSLADVAHGRR